jgi:hypothetical protein
MPTDDPRIDPDELRQQQFPTAFRGFETNAVNAHLHSMAQRVEALNRWIDDVLAEQRRAGTPDEAIVVVDPEVVAEAELAHPTAGVVRGLSELDDDALVGLVGEETARVLGTARRAADEIKNKAGESAARTLRLATEQAHARKTEAESTASALVHGATEEAAMQRADAQAESATLLAEATGVRDLAVADAEAVAAKIRVEVDAEVTALRAVVDEEVSTSLAEGEAARTKAAADAEAIVEMAKVQGRHILEEVKTVRSRMLDDLSERRRLGRAQLERLAAGRDRLLDAYSAVRTNLDDITTSLAKVLPDGRAFEDERPELEEALQEIESVEVALVGGEAAQLRPSVYVTAPVVLSATPDDETHTEAPDTQQSVATEVDEVDEVDEVEPAVEVDEILVDDDAHPDLVELIDDTDEEVVVEPEAGAVDVREVVAETGDIDALFERIRTTRAETVAHANDVLAGAGPVEVPSATPEMGPVLPVAVEVLADVGHLVPAPLLEHRSDVLRRLGPGLHKAVKRVLADEQNEVLDSLRRTGVTDPDEFLPAQEQHLLSYASVAAGPLHAVAAAAAARSGGSADAVGALAESLAANIVDPFRRRISRSAAEADGDADELDDRIRALYREWKTKHVAIAVDDALLAVYAAGQFSAAPDGALLSWRVDPEQGPCPDAEDNALSGAVMKGEVFPTGDVCPQAHPGCRCLLVGD